MLCTIPPRCFLTVPGNPTQTATRVIAACCSVLQCVAVCCSVLQCIAVCCSIWDYTIKIATRVISACAIRYSRNTWENQSERAREKQKESQSKFFNTTHCITLQHFATLFFSLFFFPLFLFFPCFLFGRWKPNPKNSIFTRSDLLWHNFWHAWHEVCITI